MNMLNFEASSNTFIDSCIPFASNKTGAVYFPYKYGDRNLAFEMTTKEEVDFANIDMSTITHAKADLTFNITGMEMYACDDYPGGRAVSSNITRAGKFFIKYTNNVIELLMSMGTVYGGSKHMSARVYNVSKRCVQYHSSCLHLIEVSVKTTVKKLR